jgi:hypothetical protein
MKMVEDAFQLARLLKLPTKERKEDATSGLEKAGERKPKTDWAAMNNHA